MCTFTWASWLPTNSLNISSCVWTQQTRVYTHSWVAIHSVNWFITVFLVNDPFHYLYNLCSIKQKAVRIYQNETCPLHRDASISHAMAHFEYYFCLPISSHHLFSGTFHTFIFLICFKNQKEDSDKSTPRSITLMRAMSPLACKVASKDLNNELWNTIVQTVEIMVAF